MTFEFLKTAPFFIKAQAIAKAKFSQITHSEASKAFLDGSTVVALNSDGTFHELTSGDELPEFVAIQNFK